MGSSNAIRGSEATLSITVEGRRFTLLTKDWRVEPDFELKKDDYAGQRGSLPNPQFNGTGFSFSCDEEDESALELREFILAREEAGLSPPLATIQCRYKYRKVGTRARIELLSAAVLKPGTREQGGRKENITNSFEGFTSARPKLLTV